MKCNIDTVLVGSNVVLVPYAASHVPAYHEWMLSEELRQLTASEPLSLEEEYEMQRNWQVDEDKLTFIILSNGDALFGPDETVLPSDPRFSRCPMVGDVNLFLTGTLERLRLPLGHAKATDPEADLLKADEDDQENEDDAHTEVEIMIAEPFYRRKGYALEALRLMLKYATGSDLGGELQPSDVSEAVASPLGISPTRLITRISESNVASRKLFEKLGFVLTKHIAVFEEVEMRWKGPVS